METICNSELCTGCSACMNACPHNAITMQGDAYGFVYPSISQDSCVDCGLCKRVCPAVNEVMFHKPTVAYATYSKGNDDRNSSASGGASSVLANWFVANEGVVYGCAQECVDCIYHTRISDAKDLYKIKGSKYVQSSVGESFRQVKKDLIDGRKVLFIGTPCQVSGLRSYLKKDYENLFLVDICCHGVPSQQLLVDNVELVKRKHHIKVDNSMLKVAFRRKFPNVEFGFHMDSFNPEMKPDIQYGFFLGGVYDRKSMRQVYEKLVNRDYYITGFLNGVFFRPSCYQCKYAQSERVSDLTLADYWGLGKSDNPEMNEQRGVSAILINTEKGEVAFDNVKDMLVYEKRDVIEAIKGNPQLCHPFKKPTAHDVFMNIYLEDGWEKACRKSFGLNMIKQRVREFLRSSAILTNVYRRIRYGK